MNRTYVRRSIATASALALAATLAACGGAANESGSGSDSTGAGNGGAAVSGTISGAGASSQAAAVEAWKAGFEGANPGATVNYDPVGSGGGRTQFLAGGVQFAGSDAYLKKEELDKVSGACKGGDVIEAPVYVSPIAIAYKVDGVTDLQLSAPTIAKIFAGKITKWDDAAIKADNPNATLPSTAITPVHRSDESGTTENFTDYLAKAAPADWTHEADGAWPISGGEAAKGTSGVVQAIRAGNGTIGYADESQVGDLGKAKVKVGEEYVEISPEAAAKIIDESTPVADRPEFSYALDLKRDTTAGGTYPIVLAAYSLACTKYENQAQADLVKSWMTYIFSEEGQKVSQQAAGSAPISEKTREAAMKGINTISAAG
ncbi:MAG: phosphate ABC transporter substrate-binding protein PstS [Dermatophilus congolensis]|nr:phosphate ABC transporter substrate-binding protein PstS [Dermatophilus congolensis]